MTSLESLGKKSSSTWDQIHVHTPSNSVGLSPQNCRAYLMGNSYSFSTLFFQLPCREPADLATGNLAVFFLGVI